MSDFLTHLAARAVSSVPVIRPLIRSVYEPVSEGEITWPAEVAPEPVVRVGEPATAAPLQVPPVKELTHETTTERIRNERFSHSSVREIEVPPPVAPVPAVSIVDRIEPVETKSRLLPAASVERVLERSEPATINPENPPVLQTPIAVASPPILIESPTPVPPVIAPSAVIETVVKSLNLPRPKTRTMSQFPPDRSPARAAAPTYPPSPPEVTITIGRVEIRAAAPAALPSEPVPVAGPPLSLETYLRRSASRSA